MHRNTPKPSKDAFWDEIQAEVPYTKGSNTYKTDPFFGSTAEMNIPAKQSEWMPEPEQMPPIDEVIIFKKYINKLFLRNLQLVDFLIWQKTKCVNGNANKNCVKLI